jgi:hypothetical protein
VPGSLGGGCGVLNRQAAADQRVGKPAFQELHVIVEHVEEFKVSLYIVQTHRHVLDAAEIVRGVFISAWRR